MKTFYTTGQKNNGFYLASIEYNNGADGLNGRGKDEEPRALKISEKLKEIGWELAFLEEQEIAFNIYDHSEYEEFCKDFQRIRREIK